MVDSHAATSLAKAMGHSLLASLDHGSGSIPTSDAIDHCIASSIVGLANDIQAILGDALATATDTSPHKPPAKPGRDTIPRHLWPKSVKHDVSTIRRRAKSIRRLINQEMKAQRCSSPSELPSDPYPSLWSSVNNPLSLHTILNPPPKDMDCLWVLLRPETTPMDSATIQAAYGCFKGLRRATRLLIRHARNLRRLKYGKALLRLFAKNPSAAL
jgi:hypothetical protein